MTPQSLCCAVVYMSNGQQFAAKTTLKDQQVLTMRYQSGAVNRFLGLQGLRVNERSWCKLVN